MSHRIIYILFGLFFLYNFGDKPLIAEESVTGLSILYSNDINGYLEPCG
jgi:hypothetical protein